MSAFGTSELAILKATPRFGETTYVCDVEKMIESIRRTYEAMFSETARRPCAIHLHPADHLNLRMDMRCASTVEDGVPVDYFMSMRAHTTTAVEKGFAQLSICPGCQTYLGVCANRRVWK